MQASAALDPDSGRIVGFVMGQGGRPGKIELRLDGQVVSRQIALAPVGLLGPTGVGVAGAPPVMGCCFAARLPADAAGHHLAVVQTSPQRDGNVTLLTHEFENDAALGRYREGSLMSDGITAQSLRFQAGIFRATISSAAGGKAPVIELHIRGNVIGVAELAATGDPKKWEMAAAVPPSVLSDGVQILEFSLADGSVLARYPIASGAALAGDLASEVASLRAELDQLKRSFRSAMAPGVLTRDERPMIVAEALMQVDNLLELRDRREQQVAADSAIPDWDDDGGLWEPDL
jgi:hypothetical protein